MKCCMQTTSNYNGTHSTEVRPKNKNQVKPKTKKPTKTKSEMNMQIGDVSSKMQQITCKSEMSVPNCKNTNNKQKQQRIQKIYLA